MTTQCNVIKGRDFGIEISQDDGATWLYVGGIQQRTLTINNPSSDTTNTSDRGNFSSNEFNGYSSLALTASGVLDQREDTDLVNAFKLVKAAYDNGCRRAMLHVFTDQIGDQSANEVDIVGYFHLNSLELSSEQQGKLNWSMDAINGADVTAVIA